MVHSAVNYETTNLLGDGWVVPSHRPTNRGEGGVSEHRGEVKTMKPFNAPAGWREVKLTEVLSANQLRKVITLARAKQLPELREYLHSISADLERKGVLADYLYYSLLAMFKLSTPITESNHETDQMVVQ